MPSAVLAPLPIIAPEPRVRLRPPAARTTAVSVVVVNYRQWKRTARLVLQLRQSHALGTGTGEVVIVDNHSPVHPLMPRLRRTEGVSLRRWGRNRGFARGVNEGVRLSRGRWILLLNPDVSVPAGFLDLVEELTERLERDEPRTGIVGLGLSDPDGRRQPSTGPVPTLLGTLARLLLPRRWRKYDLVSTPDSRVGWVTGCCLLVRRELLDELGGLDPDFFLYYEDVDLCRRARERGWDVRHEPSVSAIHHHPLHGRTVSPYLRLLTRHALLTYAAKHWPAWQGKLLSGLVRCEAWVRGTLARWRGDVSAGGWFRRLGRLAAAMGSGRPHAARRQLERAVREWERRQSDAPRPVDRHPEPQPAGPAPRLRGERLPSCSAGDTDRRRR